MDNLYDALEEQLKDLFSAETQLVEALPKMAAGSTNKELKQAFENHLKETRQQLERLEQIGTQLEIELTGHTCHAMKGLIKEGSETLSEDYENVALRDVQLVAAAQRVEHYEIAGYGNAIALAEYLELSDVAEILGETIAEEGNADKTLTALCQSTLFAACEDSESDDDESSARSSSRSV